MTSQVIADLALG